MGGLDSPSLPDGAEHWLLSSHPTLVTLWSMTAAVAMSVVAAVLPPIAVVIANWGEDR
jgi:hypothetical protein